MKPTYVFIVDPTLRRNELNDAWALIEQQVNLAKKTSRWTRSNNATLHDGSKEEFQEDGRYPSPEGRLTGKVHR